MHPPAGRIQIGEHVLVPGDRPGEVVAERPIHSNGAWSYTVRFDDDSTGEHLDYELRRPASES